MFSLLQLSLSVLLWLAPSGSSPTQSTSKSGLVLLKHNDLYGDQSPRAATALLLDDGLPGTTAKGACQGLGENLWSPEVQNFSDGLKDALTYQQYLDNFATGQKFWIQSPKANKCRSINAKGQIASTSCEHRLPTLCTQSAPQSYGNSAANSTRYRVSQETKGLTLTGYRDSVSWRFLGVRFAPEPERFTHSTLYSGKGVQSALDYGSQCSQASGGSEDCLFLNIWTPYLPQGSHPKQKKLKPVMLWYYGGGNTGGSANDPGSDGGNLASRGDVVVVESNYRLGAFGWLALNNGQTTGNYGLGDTVTALRWVRENIKAFGGDPDRITVFGESAGASNVRALLASPKAKGLFSAAIMESTPGQLVTNGPYTQYQTVEKAYNSTAVPLLTATNCLDSSDQLACLRAVDSTVLASFLGAPPYPVIDGAYLTTDQLQLTGNGYAAHVPVMIGHNRNELAISVPRPFPFTNASQAIELIGAAVGVDFTAAAASGLFPAGNGPNATLNAFDAVARVVSDGGIICAGEATAYSGVKHDIFPSVHYFQFNRTYQPANFDVPECHPAATASHPLGDPDLEYSKCHAGEVSYVFGVLPRLGQPDRDGLDIPFSQLVIDYWSSFARKHDPNPDLSYLVARGYSNTTSQVKISGAWKPVRPDDFTIKQLQWTGLNIPAVEIPQCAVLGYPITYYETNP